MAIVLAPALCVLVLGVPGVHNIGRREGPGVAKIWRVRRRHGEGVVWVGAAAGAERIALSRQVIPGSAQILGPESRGQRLSKCDGGGDTSPKDEKGRRTRQRRLRSRKIDRGPKLRLGAGLDASEQ